MPEISLSEKALEGRSNRYMENLNQSQRQAVETLDGPVLVLAGAGTGKTRALTARIAHLLANGKANPNQILSVTFTNKAAREMKHRISEYIGNTVEGMPWLGTFHSLCAKFLRRHAELVGLKPNFTILDTDDQLRLLKQLIRMENIDEKRWTPKLLAGIIDRWKNQAWIPNKLPKSELSAFNSNGQVLYKNYQERLKILNSVDFGDLLLHMITIFQQNPDVLEKYQSWLRFILVDEYQDTNVAQYLWLRLLAGGHKNICCVGDDDQSIYGWRGAEVRNILSFEKDFPGATIIKLEQNYRSSQHILAAASKIITSNESRLGKTLWTEISDGEKVRLIGHWDGEEEARWLGDEIESLGLGTRGLRAYQMDEIAILVRASFQMRAFEDRFVTTGIPYRVIGGPRFYERKEIRDAIAYLRVSSSSEDGLAFERIVNTPKRGIGEKAIQTLNHIAREKGVSLFYAAKLAVSEQLLPSKQNIEMVNLLKQFDHWSSLLKDSKKTHVEITEEILDESGYTHMLLEDKAPDAPGRLENLKEFVKALEEFENIEGFLEHIALVMENEGDESVAKVSIMTLHGSKGLEFPIVFLPGWEDGLFPSQRSMDESGLKGLEEERRLAHVGITRAKELCHISFASNRRIYNQWQNALPSRFIDELPSEDIEVVTLSNAYSKDIRYDSQKQSYPSYVQENNSFSNMPVTDLNKDIYYQKGSYNSPGWVRLKSKTQKPTKMPKFMGSEQNPKPISFLINDRVFHQKFGYGIVKEVDGEKITVDFEKSDKKDIKSGFLNKSSSVTE